MFLYFNIRYYRLTTLWREYVQYFCSKYISKEKFTNKLSKKSHDWKVGKRGKTGWKHIVWMHSKSTAMFSRLPQSLISISLKSKVDIRTLVTHHTWKHRTLVPRNRSFCSCIFSRFFPTYFFVFEFFDLLFFWTTKEPVKTDHHSSAYVYLFCPGMKCSITR